MHVATALARSSSGGVAVPFELPVLWVTSCFPMSLCGLCRRRCSVVRRLTPLLLGAGCVLGAVRAEDIDRRQRWPLPGRSSAAVPQHGTQQQTRAAVRVLRENTYFTFFSDFKKRDCLRFFEMTCQKVVKGRSQKHSPQFFEMSSHRPTLPSGHCNSFQLFICQYSVFEELGHAYRVQLVEVA